MIEGALGWLGWLDLAGMAVFAASGALVASRRQMDLVGFALLGTFSGIGGGTLRDVILDRPVFWVTSEAALAVCLGVSVAVYFGAHLVQRRHAALVWLDAIGLAAYGALGAHIALSLGAGPVTAVALGVMTATFGGLIRDVVSGEKPLILGEEIYATAALLTAGLFVAGRLAGAPVELAGPVAVAAGFGLRAGAILRGWKLPRYRPRPGREV